tara:strand:+ start:1709 stop:2002 length:294 start_codon:yes stop_codon:yes gene_type:complete
MVQKLIFNENASLGDIEFDFILRGYKNIPNQDHISVAKYSVPGKNPLQKEIFLHYSNTKLHFWCWIPDDQCDRFLCSKNVDYNLTANRVCNISTQTD